MQWSMSSGIGDRHQDPTYLQVSAVPQVPIYHAQDFHTLSIQTMHAHLKSKFSENGYQYAVHPKSCNRFKP